jgi:hypothetical protein
MFARRPLAVACVLLVAAGVPAAASATITITAQGGSIDPVVSATTDGPDGGGRIKDPKTIPTLPGVATPAPVSGPPAVRGHRP